MTMSYLALKSPVVIQFHRVKFKFLWKTKWVAGETFRRTKLINDSMQWPDNWK